MLKASIIGQPRPNPAHLSVAAVLHYTQQTYLDSAVSNAISLENAKKIPFPPLKSKDTAQQHISSQMAQLEELRSLMTSEQQVVQDD